MEFTIKLNYTLVYDKYYRLQQNIRKGFLPPPFIICFIISSKICIQQYKCTRYTGNNLRCKSLLNRKSNSSKNIFSRTCSHHVPVHNSPKKLNSVRSQEPKCIKSKRHKTMLVISACLIIFTDPFFLYFLATFLNLRAQTNGWDRTSSTIKSTLGHPPTKTNHTTTNTMNMPSHTYTQTLYMHIL